MTALFWSPRSISPGTRWTLSDDQCLPRPILKVRSPTAENGNAPASAGASTGPRSSLNLNDSKFHRVPSQSLHGASGQGEDPQT